MAKLSKTFLLIGGILAILLLVTFLALSAVFIALGSPMTTEVIRQLLEEGSINSDLPGTIEEQIAAIQIIFVSIGVVFACFVPFEIASIIVAFKGRKSFTKGLLTANIVFGILSASSFNIAGGIIGLIANARIERNNRNSNVVDAQ